MNYYEARRKAIQENKLIVYVAEKGTLGYSHYWRNPIFMFPDEKEPFKRCHIEARELRMDCWYTCEKNQALYDILEQSRYMKNSIPQLNMDIESAKRQATIAALVAIAVLIWKVIETVI